MNEIIIDNDTATLVLRGKRTVIDLEDLPRVRMFRWYVSSLGYVKASIGGTTGFRSEISLSRLICSFPDGFVDHKDRDPLNNRKSNLRVASPVQNGVNADRRRNNKYRGVAKSGKNKFQARIMYNKKLLHLGQFKTEEEAARRYDVFARAIWGEFAMLNFTDY